MANGQWGGQKTIRSELEVSAEVDAQCEVFPRLREAWDALEWILSRTAETLGIPSHQDGNLRLYVQADDALANVPAIWIVFRVGEEVEILAVNIVAPVSDEDED